VPVKLTPPNNQSLLLLPYGPVVPLYFFEGLKKESFLSVGVIAPSDLCRIVGVAGEVLACLNSAGAGISSGGRGDFERCRWRTLSIVMERVGSWRLEGWVVCVWVGESGGGGFVEVGESGGDEEDDCVEVLWRVVVGGFVNFLFSIFLVQTRLGRRII
jgi:hypothetical protein